MISPQALEKANRESMSFIIDQYHSEGIVYVAEKRLSDGKDYWLGHPIKNLHDPEEQMQFLETAVLAFERTEELIKAEIPSISSPVSLKEE